MQIYTLLTLIWSLVFRAIFGTLFSKPGGLDDLHTRDSIGRRGSGKRTMPQGEDISSEYGME